MTFRILVLLIAGSLIFSCRQQRSLSALQLPEGKQVVFLDSLQASVAILDDDREHFFDLVTITDMSIQMKRSYPEGTVREKVLNEYHNFLKQDVASFSQQEITFVKKVFRRAFELTDQISDDIFPDEIQLIKTKGKHYGPSVYYTRENRIIIPANELVLTNEQDFLEVMLHEVFHIYSRYHPDMRDSLYALIGFERLPGPVLLPSRVRETLLLNPDGIDFHYAIGLIDSEGSEFNAIPLLRAVPPAFDPGRPFFFSYIDFQLYRVEGQVGSGFRIYAGADGNSGIQLQDHPEFFRQITDNTQYIIHPDEIMADDFTALILSRTNEIPYQTERFSKEGVTLLNQMRRVLEKG